MTEQNAVAPAQSFSLCDLWIATRDLLSTVNNNSAEYSKTLTNFKRDYVFWHATTNVRLIELGAATLLISLVSWKRKAGVTRTLRNSVIGYFGFGFILVPEIYNPLINSKKD